MLIILLQTHLKLHTVEHIWPKKMSVLCFIKATSNLTLAAVVGPEDLMPDREFDYEKIFINCTSRVTFRYKVANTMVYASVEERADFSFVVK